MGLILLVGLIVKNGIILLDAARHLAASGTEHQAMPWPRRVACACGRSS